MSKTYNLGDWLKHLETKKIIDLGLNRVRQVASRLDLLCFDSLVITIAGTNGKGSTVAALEAIYRKAGLTTASFTSPHIFRFNERIKIDGHPVSDNGLCEAFQIIEQARGEIELTYFEFATLAALYLFKQVSIDVIILEVGLGGRLDATNIVDADCAIITSIGFDHMSYLGDTLESIGYEKAGIFRKDQYALYGGENNIKSITAHADAIGTKLLMIDKDFDSKAYESNSLMIKPSNAACAATAVKLITPQVSQQVITQGLSDIRITARRQWVENNVLIDVAHNLDSVKFLLQELIRAKPDGKVMAVFSMYQDKPIRECIELINSYIDEWYVAPMNSQRSASKEQLLAEFSESDVVYSFSDLRLAYEGARCLLDEQDLLLVFGSFEVISTLFQNESEWLEYC